MTVILLAVGVVLQLVGAVVLANLVPLEELVTMGTELRSTLPLQKVQWCAGTVTLVSGALIAGGALLPRKRASAPSRFVLHSDARRGRVSRQNAAALLGAALLPPFYFLLAALLLV